MAEEKPQNLVAETYAAYWMLHGIGFPDSRLRVAVVTLRNGFPVPGDAVTVQVLSRGKPVFTIVCSRTDVDLKKFDADWTEFLNKRESMSERALNELVDGTDVRKQQVQLLFSLAQKGLLGPDGRAKTELYVVGQA